MKLKELNRGPKDNRFCGPAVISFITGINTSDAASIIRTQTGRRAVKGTYTGEVQHALLSCGYTIYQLQKYRKAGERPTLAQWLRENKDIRTAGRVFLVVAGNHWQIISGRKYACGRVGRICSVTDKAVKRRARVEEVYEVLEMVSGPDRKGMARQKTKEALAEITATRKFDRREAISRATAKRSVHRIAERHGIEIEVDNFPCGGVSIYLAPPEWLREKREAGEVDFSTVAYDWGEAGHLVDTLVELIKDEVSA